MTMPGLQWLELLIGYMVCGLVGLFGIAVLWQILTGKIDLNLLISEKSQSGQAAASMSRFQFLIFTFVISLSLFLIVVSNAKLRQTDENAKRAADQTLPGFPEIPGGVLALLGISASSYTVSKAIQANKDQTPDSGQAAIKK
jgi:type IV secretory pathway VirB6-like protein